ncbi:ESAT-6 protein secretion system EspG family protein [Prauserella shujinwangii]|uniref:ESAT-6 protein secretion system EspG family protein n=1 Tax=Prauserella shujinwangii TaxID=1453103 RepID=A0A2T0M1S1_9PSEU|nr:ESX secretion-associated protein EspG [Prauserella shujinwangii]PRX50523.1 ESAT-6 protein secretion system EspG family protein [Prauserella shujinwangii]
MAELLTPLELDFLWESFGAGELPYPLEARSHGETMDERAALRRRTFAELARRGVLDDAGRLDPRVGEHFEILAAPDLSLDSVYVASPGGDPVLAVVAALGGTGVRAVQDARGLHLDRVPADGLASAVVGLLPAVARGVEKSITVPLEQLIAGPGADFMQRRAPAPDGGRASVDEDRKALARLHAQPRLRGGQIGANARSRSGGKSRMPVLSWFDTETGRYFTQATRGQDGRDWITIAPADAATLRHRLSEMLAGAANATTAPL